MVFTIDESFLPHSTAQPMTDEQFAHFCTEHPDLFFENVCDGELIVMPPNYTLTAARHRAILTQLDRWAQVNKEGTVTDGAVDFCFPTGHAAHPTPPGRLNLASVP